MCREFEEWGGECMEKGRKEGREENQLSTAQRMLAAGKLALEEIAEYSGLSLEAVRQLAAEMAQ